jgi:hypothetical protein
VNARAKPQTRFFAALIAATLFAVAAGLQRTPADATPAAIAAKGVTIAKATATPAAQQVNATAVLLPQIVVRPTAAERAAATHEPRLADNSPFVQPGDSTASAGGGVVSSPRMNFEMPYYAFGKVPARSSGPK